MGGTVTPSTGGPCPPAPQPLFWGVYASSAQLRSQRSIPSMDKAAEMKPDTAVNAEPY